MTTRQANSESHKLILTLRKAQMHMNSLSQEPGFYILGDFISSLDGMVHVIDQKIECAK